MSVDGASNPLTSSALSNQNMPVSEGPSTVNAPAQAPATGTGAASAPTADAAIAASTSAMISSVASPVLAGASHAVALNMPLDHSVSSVDGKKSQALQHASATTTIVSSPIFPSSTSQVGTALKPAGTKPSRPLSDFETSISLHTGIGINTIVRLIEDYRGGPEIIFINYFNGIFKNGIVCSARAQNLKILLTSSLDVHPRNPHEVEVNFIKDKEGLMIATNHPQDPELSAAKGAICVALERRNDTLVLNLPPGLNRMPFSSAQIAEFEEVYDDDDERRDAMEEMMKNQPLILPSHILDTLSKRAESCIFMLSTMNAIKLDDNDGKPKLTNSNGYSEFHKQCEIIGGR